MPRITSIATAIAIAISCTVSAHAGEPPAANKSSSKSQQLKAACIKNPQHPICQELARKAAARKAARGSKIQSQIDEVLGAVKKEGN